MAERTPSNEELTESVRAILGTAYTELAASMHRGIPIGTMVLNFYDLSEQVTMPNGQVAPAEAHLWYEPSRQEQLLRVGSKETADTIATLAVDAYVVAPQRRRFGSVEGIAIQLSDWNPRRGERQTLGTFLQKAGTHLQMHRGPIEYMPNAEVGDIVCVPTVQDSLRHRWISTGSVTSPSRKSRR